MGHQGALRRTDRPQHTEARAIRLPNASVHGLNCAMGVTVARILSQVGMLSRRDALRAIRLGRVTMNGQTVTDAVQKADLNDDVTLDVQLALFVCIQCKPGQAPLTRCSHAVLSQGRPVAFTAPTPQIWKYYKPRGLITTHSDPGGRQTVFQSLPRWMPRVVSVGRLDVDSEGLLLLSTSGELTGHLMHPSNGYIREYEALVVTGKERSITSAMIEQLASGLTLKSGVKFNPIETDRHLKGATRGAEWVRMRLSEGKHREVRRCWEGAPHASQRAQS